MDTVRQVVVGGIALIVGAWSIIDGVRWLRGLGFYAPGGRLGPWADLLQRLGIDPDSRLVAVVFVVYGASLLAAAAAHLCGSTAGSIALIVVAASGLWYLPVGTLGSLIIMGVVGWEMMARS